MSLRLVVLLSGNGSNLEAILEQIAEGKLAAEVVAVLSNNPQAYGLERATRRQIPTLVVDHRQYPDREAYDRALIAQLDPYSPDLVVLAGFMRILSPVLVQHYQGRLINIHPSLLPKYQGLHTHQRALAAGDAEHGTSVHFVTEELDGGPLIAQARLKIAPDATEQSLTESVKQLEYCLYPEVIRWFAEKRLELRHGQPYLDQQPLRF